LVVEWAEMHKDELRANWARARAHDVSPQSTRCPSIPLVVAVTAVAPLDGYRLQLRFDDGSERVVDLSEALWGPMAEPLRDPDYFRLVRVDPELRTVAWPNGFDLDPDVLHGDYEPDSAPSPAVPEPRGA
jgi:Protein of unknown function (DUF2442)